MNSDYKQFAQEKIGGLLGFSFSLMYEYGINEGLILTIIGHNDLMSIKELGEYFPFMSKDTTRRTLDKLVKKEILFKTRKVNQHNFDNTVYYGIER